MSYIQNSKKLIEISNYLFEELNFQETDENGSSLLMHCINESKDDNEALKICKLIAELSDVNTVNINGENAIYIAKVMNFKNTYRFLEQKGCSLYKRFNFLPNSFGNRDILNSVSEFLTLKDKTNLKITNKENMQNILTHEGENYQFFNKIIRLIKLYPFNNKYVNALISFLSTRDVYSFLSFENYKIFYLTLESRKCCIYVLEKFIDLGFLSNENSAEYYYFNYIHRYHKYGYSFDEKNFNRYIRTGIVCFDNPFNIFCDLIENSNDQEEKIKRFESFMERYEFNIEDFSKVRGLLQDSENFILVEFLHQRSYFSDEDVVRLIYTDEDNQKMEILTMNICNYFNQNNIPFKRKYLYLAKNCHNYITENVNIVDTDIEFINSIESFRDRDVTFNYTFLLFRGNFSLDEYKEMINITFYFKNHLNTNLCQVDAFMMSVISNSEIFPSNLRSNIIKYCMELYNVDLESIVNRYTEMDNVTEVYRQKIYNNIIISSLI